MRDCWPSDFWLSDCSITGCSGHCATLRRDILPRSDLPIASGVHARCFNASKRGIKKLCVGDKGTVKLRRKETIAWIRNPDRASRSLISRCEFGENVRLEKPRLAHPAPRG